MADAQLNRMCLQAVGLPRVCAVCGQPATTSSDGTFTWYPKWILIGLLGGAIVYALLHICLRQQLYLRIPLCNDHSGHWSSRYLLIAVSFLVIAALTVGAALLIEQNQPRHRDNGGLICGAVGVGILVWFVLVAIAQNTAICMGYTDHQIVTLRGVHESFVAAAYQQQHAAMAYYQAQYQAQYPAYYGQQGHPPMGFPTAQGSAYPPPDKFQPPQF